MNLLLALLWITFVTAFVAGFAWLVVKYDLPRPRRREHHPRPGE